MNTATQDGLLAATPYTIVIDSGEQLPYAFARPLSWDARRPPLRVQTAPGKLFLRDTQLSCDYSVRGFEDKVAVERKSLADAFGTFGKGRARFERKLALLDTYDYATMVIEAEWSWVLAYHQALVAMEAIEYARQTLAKWPGDAHATEACRQLTDLVEPWLRPIVEAYPSRSKMLPKSVLMSVLAWQQRFPRVHWQWVPGRAMGEVTTLRILDRFWRSRQ